jgi:hypothetical protein
MPTTPASLKRNDPLPPVPAGSYECWPYAPGLLIVRVVPPTYNDFGLMTQVWPPVQPKENAK